MDISVIDKTSLKIRGKRASIVVDPAIKMPKTNADAVVILKNDDDPIDTSRITDYRVIISGPGDYEVGGIKISGHKGNYETVYKLNVDDVDVLLGRVSDIIEIERETGSFDIIVLNNDMDMTSSLLTSLEPKMAVLYGKKSNENAKAIGKEDVKPIDKITVSREKLPEDKMEVILLG